MDKGINWLDREVITLKLGPNNVFRQIKILIQILVGICLAMHYTTHVNLAFICVVQIMRNVNFGCVLYYIYTNSALIFFISVHTYF